MPVALGVNGGILGSNNLPSSGSAKGIWTPNEIARAIGLGFWPLVYARTVTETSSGADNIVTVEPDPFFEYTTLLLPGNGTNGAQNNTFLDSSSNNFTITRNPTAGPNAPTQGTFSPFSQTGWGNYFDGSGDYLTATKNAAYEIGSGDFTVEAWIFPTAGGALYNSGILSYGASSSLNGWLFGITGSNVGGTLNRVMFEYNYDGTLYLSTSPVALNAWNHVAVSRSGSNIYVFLNGVLQSTTSTSKTANTNAGDVSVIGSESYSPSDGNRIYTGYISNLRLVKGTALYTSSFTPPAAPLTAITNTSLLTCQSNRFIDNSSNNFTITKNGDTRVVPFSPFNPTAPWSAAIYGGSGYFDGTGDYLTSPSSSAYLPSTTTTPFTLECWVYNTGTSATLLYSALALENYGFVLGFGSGVGTYDSTATPWFAYYSGSWSGIRSTVSIPINAWTHIACVFTGSTCLIFQNGVQTASGGPSTWPSFAASVLRIGCRPDAINVFTGYISGVRIVNGTAVYTAGFTPPTAPVTAITNTSLLLNFTNAGIYDATSKNDLETVGNAQISTTQSKWGGSSMAFDGTGDYLLTNVASADLYTFGTGNFTIEMWVYVNSLPGTDMVIYDGRPSNGAYPCIILQGSTNKIIWYVNTNIQITATSVVPTSTWFHLAISRSGTSTKMFVDGTQSGSTYNDSTNYLGSANRPYIGANATTGTQSFNGYIQDLRVTKGYARYTANFTAPTAAFPTL